jgi:hypothetical protein
MAKRFLELPDLPLTTIEKPLRVLVLADDRQEQHAVIDHISSIVNGSQHQMNLINPIYEPPPDLDELQQYDALLIHYSIYIIGAYYLSANWVDSVVQFDGLKVQIIQDEYRDIDKMKAQMRLLGVRRLVSCLPLDAAKKVYSGKFMSNIDVYARCLPGYFSKRLLEKPKIPMGDREFDVIYRGRELPWSAGLHAREKSDIAYLFSEWTSDADLNMDLETLESKRLVGMQWDEFLMNSKSMIATEGGISIFDFDGTIHSNFVEFQDANPEGDFYSYWEQNLKQHEGNVIHKTITPKIFEAIALRTALILFPGDWSEILEPDRHFIVLERDGSNISDVISKLNDVNFLTDLVERTYSEIAEREILSFTDYVNRIDNLLATELTEDNVGDAEKAFLRRIANNNLENQITNQELLEIKDSLLQLTAELATSNQLLEMAEAKLEHHRLETEQLLEMARASASSERDAVVVERDAAVVERDAAVVERDAAVVERDAAVVERDAAVVERDDLNSLKGALSIAKNTFLKFWGGSVRSRSGANKT